MGSKFLSYVGEALMGGGFAFVDLVWAWRHAPHLWRNALDAVANETPSLALQVARAWPGVQAYRVQIEDCPASVEVLARSPARLAERIGEITGQRVLSVEPVEPPPRAPAEPPPPRAAGDDRYAGVVTKESGRTCASCEHFSAGGACLRADLSGLARPAPRALRRCPAYAPDIESFDGRTGAQLWPELAGASEPQGGRVNERGDDTLGQPPASALQAATAWLRRELLAGPQVVPALRARAETAGHAWRTVQRAAEALGVDGCRMGFGEPAAWQLPGGWL